MAEDEKNRYKSTEDEIGVDVDSDVAIDVDSDVAIDSDIDPLAIIYYEVEQRTVADNSIAMATARMAHTERALAAFRRLANAETGGKNANAETGGKNANAEAGGKNANAEAGGKNAMEPLLGILRTGVGEIVDAIGDNPGAPGLEEAHACIQAEVKMLTAVFATLDPADEHKNYYTESCRLNRMLIDIVSDDVAATWKLIKDSAISSRARPPPRK